MGLNTIKGPNIGIENGESGNNKENHEKELREFTRKMGEKVFDLVTGKIKDPNERKKTENYFKNMTRNSYEEWMKNYLNNKK